MRIYIAGPYASNPIDGVANAISVANQLLDRGYVPFVPHLAHFMNLCRPRPEEKWLLYDFEWLEKCDCLLRLPGESKGADLEVKRAKELGIPVKSLEDFGLAGEKKEAKGASWF